MSKSKCTKRGGTLQEACKAIFECVVPGKPNNWFTYQCQKCDQYHIISEPKK